MSQYFAEFKSMHHTENSWHPGKGGLSSRRGLEYNSWHP